MKLSKQLLAYAPWKWREHFNSRKIAATIYESIIKLKGLSGWSAKRKISLLTYCKITERVKHKFLDKSLGRHEFVWFIGQVQVKCSIAWHIAIRRTESRASAEVENETVNSKAKFIDSCNLKKFSPEQRAEGHHDCMPVRCLDRIVRQLAFCGNVAQ